MRTGVGWIVTAAEAGAREELLQQQQGLRSVEADEAAMQPQLPAQAAGGQGGEAAARARALVLMPVQRRGLPGRLPHHLYPSRSEALLEGQQAR
jgi:hypothetical protein